MRWFGMVAGISMLLFSEGCVKDKEFVADDDQTLLINTFQRLQFDEEVSGQLSPFELYENPGYTPIHEIDYIYDNELVFVSKACGIVLVYPHRNMLVEAVNEDAHGVLMAVTYCPITRSGISLNRVLGNDTLLFTASGYLLKENMMPLDVNSGSIWSQMRLQGMSGKHDELTVGTFPLIETTWGTVTKYFQEAGVFTSNSLLKSSAIGDGMILKGFPIGQEFGILSWDKAELFTLNMFPGEISLHTTIVRPGGRVVVAGSSENNFIVAFQTDYVMEPVAGEFPVIMRDETGSYWTVFGEAINGERGGEKLDSPVFYSAADWAWRGLFDTVTSFNPQTAQVKSAP